jgi:hypothetical protein
MIGFLDHNRSEISNELEAIKSRVVLLSDQ